MSLRWEKRIYSTVDLLCFWPLVDVEFGQGYLDQAEELVHAKEVAVQHGQHDLGLVAVIRDGSARDGTKFRQTNLR